MITSDTHLCSACGFSSHRWFGRCPDCGGWSTALQPAGNGAGPEVAVTTLDAPPHDPERFAVGLEEVDRVLGGGLVAGGVVLLAGEPGIGKSTLVLQIMDALLRDGRNALLITGEESVGQVALRARRLGAVLGRFRAAAATRVEDIIATSDRERPDVIVVDSIQTLEQPSLGSPAGSVVQVRECAAALVRYAKETGTAVVVVGHVTKEGTVAGPKTLEHIVDAVLTLDGERAGTLRLLRAAKNRFGSCEEIGVFVMGADGLRGVEDPSAMLLADRRPGLPGSMVFPSLEGSRPMLVELQALVAETKSPQPRRVPIGIDARRLALLVGVLTSRVNAALPSRDIFAAAAGGVTVREPAADLALCLALFSSFSEKPLAATTVAFGEVGLGGEIRRVPGIERRLSETARLRFKCAIAPKGTGRAPGVEVIEVVDLCEAMVGARLLE